MQAYNGRDNRNNQISLLQKIRNDDAHENGDPLNAIDSIKSSLDPSFLVHIDDGTFERLAQQPCGRKK